jgi:hypothetical protein
MAGLLLQFQLLYNASLPYCYTVNAFNSTGEWQLEGKEGLLPPNHGTLVRCYIGIRARSYYGVRGRKALLRMI